MGRRSILFFLMVFPLFVVGQQKRDLLGKYLSDGKLESQVIPHDGWVPFPAYDDRASWTKIDDTIKVQLVKKAETFIKFRWPVIQATDYLAFSREGNRLAMENVFNKRREALRSLALGELVEGKGRFLDDIINGLFSYSEQTYWGYSAHFYMYRDSLGNFPKLNKPWTVLPDAEDPIVDLAVAEMGADFSWILYCFKEELDKVSPVIYRRMRQEIFDKVIYPYYERDDYWWITGWGRGKVNNWNPWCNYNVMQCVLLLETDPDKRLYALRKSMKSVDLFINSYADDGACTEGPSYWSLAAGKLFEYLTLLDRVSNGYINIYNEDIIKNMGRYIYRVHIQEGTHYVNFADATPRIDLQAGLVYRYGKAIRDRDTQDFGSYLLHKKRQEKRMPSGTLSQVFEDFFDTSEVGDRVRLPVLKSYYFEDSQIAIARTDGRTDKGFFFAAKGGTNGEDHNHNDVGSFILHYNNVPLFIDVGVGVYTGKTFSEERYSAWNLQSQYHNLPIINGVQQMQGDRYQANNVSFLEKNRQTVFSMDIGAAYPQESGAESWIRTYSLSRAAFDMVDTYHLRSFQQEQQLCFMTPQDCRVIAEGKLQVGDAYTGVTLYYDPRALALKIEDIPIDDRRIKRGWGDSLKRLIFTVKGNKLSNRVQFSVRPIGSK